MSTNYVTISFISFSNICDKKESRKLAGALSLAQKCDYITIINNDDEKEDFPDHGYLGFHLDPDSQIEEDRLQEIFVGSAGAIANAYDLNGLDKKQKATVIGKIITEHSIMYPDYDFTMLPGKFPISLYSTTVSSEEEATMVMPKANYSTHILYITNYEKHIKKEQVKQLAKKK